jgi:hypothetical protein
MRGVEMGKHNLLKIAMADLIFHGWLRNERGSRYATVRSGTDARQWTGNPFLLERRYPRKPNRINNLQECILRLAQWRRPVSSGTLAAGPALDYDYLNHAGVADQGQQ